MTSKYSIHPARPTGARRLLSLALLWLLLALTAPSAWAAPQADVVLGGHVVFHINDGKAAAKISQRIEGQLQAGMSESAIVVKAVAQDKKTKKYCVYWGSELVIAITPEMAKANGCSPEALAEAWAANMRDVVSIGLLNVDMSSCILALDRGAQSSRYAPVERRVATSGLATGKLKAVDTTGRVEVRVDEESGAIVLHGRGLGKSVVKVSKGNGFKTVSVHVKDDAGTLPKDVEIEVTGSPALGGAVNQGALLAITNQTVAKPGCRVFTESDEVATVSVPRGDHCTVSVPVGISGGEDYFDVKGNVRVLARNVALEPVEQNLLMVSNRPERVDVDGVLLNYTFRRKEPSRLMYSHLNESSTRRNLWVNLSNGSAAPLKIAIGLSSAGPERSEIYVGQTSAQRFLQDLGAQSGFITTLPPHTALELVAHDMKPKALVTGFVNLRILEGEEATVEVRTRLAPSSNDGSRLPDIGAPFNPFKIHPHGVFAQPYFEYEAEYTVGAEPLSFRYGESPWLIDFETGLPNTGNFGVLYKALVELKNPTGSSRQVGLYFEPISGPAGANFLVNGQVYQAKFRKVGDEVLVLSIELPARSNNTVEIVTFPEATSCYPCRFELRDLTEGDAAVQLPRGSLPADAASRTVNPVQGN